MRFYGYKHWTLEDVPRCFNVGKGVKKRPYSHNDRSHKWHHTVKRLGLRVEECIGPMVEDEAFAWERANIKLMGTRSNNHTHNNDDDIGCNFTDGGEGVSGHRHSDKTRAKMSKALNMPEIRAKLSKARKGHVVTEETRAKMSASRKARIITDETRTRLSVANKGRRHSIATRVKMSLAKKNISDETRIKLSVSHKGKKHTDETRAKMSAAHKNPSAETRAKLSRASKGNTNGRKQKP
jgi:hypothetical protein